MPMMGMPGMMGGARSMSAAAAGMGHLGDDLTAGDEASEQQQGRGGRRRARTACDRLTTNASKWAAAEISPQSVVSSIVGVGRRELER